MKLPPWDCYTVEDQRAFADFVMRKLDELDTADAIALANAPIPDGFMEHMEAEAEKHAVIRLARDRGLDVKKSPRPRGRPKREISNLDCAIRDVERMREIFRRYWNKWNRYTRPTRTAIAAEYWGLSAEEVDALERYVNKVAKSDK